MAKKKAAGKKSSKKPIESYAHADKQRVNNPPVGLVTPETDPLEPPKRTYAYDPHLDPQLVWSGKAERTSFDIPTVSLHVHERIDPKTIIAAVRTNGDRHPPSPQPSPPSPKGRGSNVPPSPSRVLPSPAGRGAGGEGDSPSAPPRAFRQPSLFEEPAENPPLRDAIDFYNHAKPLGWKNRLIAGDSLLVMNSLLEKEGLAGKVQMIYIDPPYGIRYGSNFQPFVNRRDVKDGKDEDLIQEPETLKAFRDTWELGIHSYLTYLRDRLLLARELLHESGSVFVQISDENLHHVRATLDEVYGPASFIGLISFAKTVGATSKFIPGTLDYIIWYSKNPDLCKYRPLFRTKEAGAEGAAAYTQVELPDFTRRRMTTAERTGSHPLPIDSRVFTVGDLTSARVRPGRSGYFPITIEGQQFLPPKREWSTHREGIDRLKLASRIARVGKGLGYVRFIDDFPAVPLTNLWSDTMGQNQFGGDKQYVVQTALGVVRRCMIMTTDPGDLVFDPTCGSGTTAYVAEQWGRRWITCDTSRVAVTLAKQRLMTALFDYYTLKHPHPRPLSRGERGEKEPDPRGERGE